MATFRALVLHEQGGKVVPHIEAVEEGRGIGVAAIEEVICADPDQSEPGRAVDFGFQQARCDVKKRIGQRQGLDQRGEPLHLGANRADSGWNEDFNAEVLRVALNRIRHHFEPATWRAFERVWLENQRAAVVAAELRIPIEVVYTAKSRVLKRLEEEVRILAEDLPQLVPLS